MIDAVDRSTSNITPEAMQELIEEMAMHCYQLRATRSRPSKPASVNDVDVVTALAVQLEALSKMVDGILAAQQRANVMQCNFYRRKYGNHECQTVQAMGDPMNKLTTWEMHLVPKTIPTAISTIQDG